MKRLTTTTPLLRPAICFVSFFTCALLAAPAPKVDRSRIQVRVVGFENAGLASAPKEAAEPIEKTYDAIIVGGGMSGMTAAWYLRDRNIVVLERKDTAGGLAFRGMTKEGIIYGRGSAYYSKPRGQVEKIYGDLGLDPLEKTAIPEPIDSYFHNGKLHKGVWEEETLKHLPKGFSRFKAAILQADEQGLVAEQPMEEGKEMRLDRMTTAEFIKPFGREVKDFLDSYSQSALGAKTDEINAMAFINFYLAEIETRYAWPGGTAGASAHLIGKLSAHNPAILKTGATVTRVRNVPEGVEVTWLEAGKFFQARSRCAIMALPLLTVAWIMDDYPSERRRLVARLPYANYMVHTVFTSRELFTTSYDTWFANRSFTDVITARWIETGGFKKPGQSGPGVLSIYQPLAPPRKVDLGDTNKVADMVAMAIQELVEMIPALAKEPRLEVESYRWPASIHVVPPGYFSSWVPKLKPPVGRVYFAGNNLGTPSFEEALYRGWRAAMDVRQELEKPVSN
jgi:oxygen-dependent protoporphyrinogen oxidase